MKNLKNKTRILKIAGSILLFLCALTVFVPYLVIKNAERKLKQPKWYETFTEADRSAEYQEIEWGGEIYEYRRGLVTILCLGIDGRGKAVENRAFGQGPKSDAIYLAVLDTEREKITFLNVSRDSMAEIQVFDLRGDDVGFYEMQIALQFANGDGLHSSCELTCAAVSRFLGGIPIHGYAALYWSAVEPIVDLVGPVPAQIPEYMAEINPLFFPETGYTELDGRHAKEYVENRDVREDGSNELRTVYQREFLQSMYAVTKEKVLQDPKLALEMWKTAEDYLVTDLTMDEMLAVLLQARKWEMEELDIRYIPGESVEGKFYNEFWVDEAGKQELLLELFYQKKESVYECVMH